MNAEKNKGGRPKIAWNEAVANKVHEMSQYGTPQDEIADLVGMSEPTLRKLYKKELRQGMCLARLGARKKFYERVMAGDTACLIFYAKTQLGWKEDKGKQDGNAQMDVAKTLAAAFREAMKSVGE